MENRIDNLKKALEYVRIFYKEVAKMLADVIELMSKEGWDSDAPGGAVTDGFSYSLDNSDRWKCYYLYKNFLNRNASTHVKGIVIFFDEYMNDFPFSIVCGNLYDLSESYEKWGIYWLALNNKEKLERLSGEVLSLDTEIRGKTITGNIFAIPLSAIESPEDVKNKIVEKLVAL